MLRNMYCIANKPYCWYSQDWSAFYL